MATPRKRPARTVVRSRPSSKNKKSARIAWPARPRLLRLAIFGVVFGLVGVATILFTLAKNEIPGGADEVVFAYEAGVPPSLTKDKKGVIDSGIQPLQMRLTGDGELLCTDGTEVTLKKGKLNGTQIRKLYDDVKRAGIETLPTDIGLTPEFNGVSQYARLTIGGTGHDRTVTIYGAADRPQAVDTIVERLNRECTRATEKIKRSEVRKVKDTDPDDPVISRLRNLLLPKAEASHRTGHTKGGGSGSDDGGSTGGGKSGGGKSSGSHSETDATNQYNRINNHRTTHYRKNALARSNCLNNMMREWTQYMGDTLKEIQHSDVNALLYKHCGIQFQGSSMNHMAEIVGKGSTEEGIFNAYLGSACHHAIIDGHRYTGYFTSPTSFVCTGVDTSADIADHYIGSSAYRNAEGALFTAHVLVGCDPQLTQCQQVFGGGTSTPPPPPPTSYDVASCDRVSVNPSIVAGSTFSATIRFYNAGGVSWPHGTGYGQYALGSNNPRDNVTWGVKRVYRTGTTEPGGIAEFTGSFRAPSTPGTYSFNWEMVKEGVYWVKDAPKDPNDGRTIAPICQAIVSVTSGSTTPPPPPPATHNDRLNTEESMSRGSTKYSVYGSAWLALQQSDGNLVLYHKNAPNVRYNTGITNGQTLTMQKDCNLVVYNSTGWPVWWSGTNGWGSGCYLKVQEDGRMGIYNSSNQNIWIRP